MFYFGQITFQPFSCLSKVLKVNQTKQLSFSSCITQPQRLLPLPGCRSWSPLVCRCPARRPPEPACQPPWWSWTPSWGSAASCWPAACRWTPASRRRRRRRKKKWTRRRKRCGDVWKEPALEYSPRPPGRCSASRPCWTSSRACSSPWLWPCPSESGWECSARRTAAKTLVDHRFGS